MNINYNETDNEIIIEFNNSVLKFNLEDFQSTRDHYPFENFSDTFYRLYTNKEMGVENLYELALLINEHYENHNIDWIHTFGYIERERYADAFRELESDDDNGVSVFDGIDEALHYDEDIEYEMNINININTFNAIIESVDEKLRDRRIIN